MSTLKRWRPRRREAPFGQDGVAPATTQLVDEGARRIVDDCYAEAVTTLREHRDELDRLAHTLLQRETLDENQAYAAAGISRETAPAPGLPPDDPPTDAENGLPLDVRHSSLPAPRHVSMSRRENRRVGWPVRRPECGAVGYSVPVLRDLRLRLEARH
jgi:hypothetical protein